MPLLVVTLMTMTNTDISFLRKLYAEAKGLREADKIVYDKLKELAKEDDND